MSTNKRRSTTMARPRTKARRLGWGSDADSASEDSHSESSSIADRSCVAILRSCNNAPIRMNSCVRSPNLDRLKFEGEYLIELPSAVIECDVEFKSRYMEQKQTLVHKDSTTAFREVTFKMISEAEWDLARSNPTTGARTHFNDDKPIVMVQAWTENRTELLYQFRVTWTTGHINLGKCTEVGFDADANLYSRTGGHWTLVVPHPEKAWSGHHRHVRKQRARTTRPHIKRARDEVTSLPPSPQLTAAQSFARVSELPESGTSESDLSPDKSIKEEPLDLQAPLGPPLVDLRLEDVEFCPGLDKTDQSLYWDADTNDSFQIGHLPDLMVNCSDLGGFAVEPSWMS